MAEMQATDPKAGNMRAQSTQTPEHADRSQAERVARLDRLSKTLDTRFRIFGIPVGWDAILGLIPGVGALVTLGPGAAMIAETARMGGRKRVMARMAANTAADMALGSLPLLGDLADVFFKSHRRNVALLKAEHARLTARPEARR